MQVLNENQHPFNSAERAQNAQILPSRTHITIRGSQIIIDTAERGNRKKYEDLSSSLKYALLNFLRKRQIEADGIHFIEALDTFICKITHPTRSSVIMAPTDPLMRVFDDWRESVTSLRAQDFLFLLDNLQAELKSSSSNANEERLTPCITHENRTARSHSNVLKK